MRMVLAGVLLFVVAGVSLAGPFAFSGQCYPNEAEALVAFRNSFPILGDTTWVWHTSSSVTVAGVVTYNIVTKPSTTNTTTARSGTLQLSPCVDVDFKKFDATIAGSIFAFFFVGTVGAWYLAKNLGLILEAVKRW